MRKLAPFLVLALVALYFASACGGGGGTPTTEPSPTATVGEPTTMSIPTVPPTPAAAGKIVFSMDREGNVDIYPLSPDGSVETRHTDDPAAQFGAAAPGAGS